MVALPELQLAEMNRTQPMMVHTKVCFHESVVSIRSGDILRLRDRNGDREPERDRDGLRDTYLEPASEGVRLPLLLLLLLLLLLPLLLLLLLLLLLRLLDRLLLRRSSSSFPSSASSNRLFLGPISPFSSRTCRFAIRGMMISQTRSSLRRASANSSMKVRE